MRGVGSARGIPAVIPSYPGHSKSQTSTRYRCPLLENFALALRTHTDLSSVFGAAGRAFFGSVDLGFAFEAFLAVAVAFFEFEVTGHSYAELGKKVAAYTGQVVKGLVCLYLIEVGRGARLENAVVNPEVERQAPVV